MRRRILASTIGVATVAVLVFAIPLGIAVARLYRDEEILRLQRRATTATRAVTADALAGIDGIELPRHEDETDIAIYGRNGRLLRGQGPDRGDTIVTGALDNQSAEHVGDSTISVAVPVTENERVVAAVRASEPRSVLDARVHRAWALMAALGIAAVAGAALIAWFVSRRLARPVESLRNAVLRLGDGDFTVRATPTGVPEIDEAGQAVDTAADQLGSLIERERAFSADASHQLRTPITNLRLGIESALGDPGIDPRDALEGALHDTDRLAGTVDELLALARDVPSQREPWPLDPLLDELEARWHGLLASEDRPLQIQHGAHVEVAAPRAAVAHILDVLVDNATRHGRGAVNIGSRESSHGGVSMTVEDDGDGITGDPDQVFERRNAGAQGNGIGLAMARNLAEAAGGRLVLQRAAPRPRFELLLPPAPRRAHAGEPR